MWDNHRTKKKRSEGRQKRRIKKKRIFELGYEKDFGGNNIDVRYSNEVIQDIAVDFTVMYQCLLG